LTCVKIYVSNAVLHLIPQQQQNPQSQLDLLKWIIFKSIYKNKNSLLICIFILVTFGINYLTTSEKLPLFNNLRIKSIVIRRPANFTWNYLLCYAALLKICSNYVQCVCLSSHVLLTNFSLIGKLQIAEAQTLYSCLLNALYRDTLLKQLATWLFY